MEVAVMSLSARDQQALDGIEDDLADSTPQLAAMLATFTQLTSNDEMPVGEEMTVARPDTAGIRRIFRPGVRRAAPVHWILKAIALMAIAVAVTAIAMAASSGGDGGGCAASWAVTCGRTAPTHSSRPARKTAVGQAPPAAPSVPPDLRLVPPDLRSVLPAARSVPPIYIVVRYGWLPSACRSRMCYRGNGR
jgi:hypothetical protein